MSEPYNIVNFITFGHMWSDAVISHTVVIVHLEGDNVREVRFSALCRSSM